MGLLLPEFQLKAPEVATIIRWLLRVILVGFLFWLVKGKNEQDQEEEQADEAEATARQNWGASKQRGGGHRADYKTQNNRFNQSRAARDPYQQQNPRQRRPPPSDGGGSTDFDAIINKMSKPKQMWEVQKDGGRPELPKPQIIKKGNSSSDLVDASPKASAAPNKEPKQPRESQATDMLKKSMLHGHMRPVTFITWNQEGNLLFTCGKDKKVCVWGFPDGDCLGTYEGHTGAVWACSVTADSSWLVTSGADRLVLAWEARTSREVARVELPGVVRFVEWAAPGPDSVAAEGERFVTAHNRFGSHPASLTVWRFDGSAIEEQLRLSNLPTPATQVGWGRGNAELASAHENGELIFWRADTGEEVRRLKAHESMIQKFDFSSDLELVATASTDKTVKVWDMGEGSEGTLLYSAETDRPLNAVALGKLTRAMAVGPESERPGCCTVIAAGGQDVRDVALSSSTSDQFDTRLLRLGANKLLEDDGGAKGHFGPVHTLAFARNGCVMASGSEDGCIRLHVFDAAALKEAYPGSFS